MLLTLSDFDLLSARSVAEACSLLRRHGADAKVFAGGTDLLVKMKHKRFGPKYLVNIKGIPGLDTIRFDEREGLRIGALATIESIKDSPVIGQEYPQLRQAASRMGTLHIRNLGTLGGNLANSSPSAEFAPALITLQASVVCTGLDGSRSVPVENFFVGPGRSVLRPDELLTEICVPRMPPGSGGFYVKRSLRRMDVAIASAAVLVVLDGDQVKEARVALGAVAPTPLRASKCEAALSGHTLRGVADKELIESASRLAAEECAPIDDVRSDHGYRRKAIAMLVEQGLEQAIRAARSERPGRRTRNEAHQA